MSNIVSLRISSHRHVHTLIHTERVKNGYLVSSRQAKSKILYVQDQTMHHLKKIKMYYVNNLYLKIKPYARCQLLKWKHQVTSAFYVVDLATHCAQLCSSSFLLPLASTAPSQAWLLEETQLTCQGFRPDLPFLGRERRKERDGFFLAETRQLPSSQFPWTIFMFILPPVRR